MRQLLITLLALCMALPIHAEEFNDPVDKFLTRSFTYGPKAVDLLTKITTKVDSTLGELNAPASLRTDLLKDYSYENFAFIERVIDAMNSRLQAHKEKNTPNTEQSSSSTSSSTAPATTQPELTSSSQQSEAPVSVASESNVESEATTTAQDTEIVTNEDVSQEPLDQDNPTLIQAPYPNAQYVPDGTNNVGQLRYLEEPGTSYTFYRWATSQDKQQDYAIETYFPVPENFESWKEQPITLHYRTSSEDYYTSSVELEIFDTEDKRVLQQEKIMGTEKHIWQQANFEFSFSGTFERGKAFRVVITPKTSNQNYVDISTFELHWNVRS